jgi:hypothetical protein
VRTKLMNSLHTLQEYSSASYARMVALEASLDSTNSADE